MPAPATIEQLIDRFRDDPRRRLSSYNETEARIHYINPLFTALGWDMDNRLGRGEVKHEDKVTIRDKAKAPDYGFYLDGRRRFFVEAKKPAVDLDRLPEPAYQLRRYAWTAKLPLSVLTDFEELAVYDTRVRPQQGDSPKVARLRYWQFEQFPAAWDEIAAAFSREAVLAGSLEQYAADKGGKKGIAPVDAAFLQTLSDWRELLARNIALRNPGIAERDLNFAVQQTIDRLLFLRIAEDRGIEPYGRLRDLATGGDVYSRLFLLYNQADARYNSGLFHFQPERGRGDPDYLTPNLNIDDKALKDVIRNLYEPVSPYEFSVFPADILGQVYEQFLGKVIRLSGKSAKVEEKPEVRKAGGVYYTPTYIVDYIVRQTVGKLLEGHSPDPAGPASRLRVLDPACGSGSFLLGAYQYLLDWHLRGYRAAPAKWSKGRNKTLHQTAAGEYHLTLAERKRILLDNLYGVDIDPQAVEVTKLSLLLKVLEESPDALTGQMALLPERALPDLGQNIKCGNSLIGPDFYDQDLTGFGKPVRSGGGTQMPLFDMGEQMRINAFDWNREFRGIMAAGGFDAVIGNPPYGAFVSENETRHLLQSFALQQYQLDTYLLFVEKGIGLTKRGGLLGMIIPNTWLLNLKSDEIRRFIFSTTQVSQIVHYRYPVFSQAVVDTEVIILRDVLPNDDLFIRVSIVEKSGETSDYSILQRNWIEADGKPVNIFERPEIVQITNRLRKYPILDSIVTITQGSKPFQVGKGKPKQTRDIVTKKPFVSDKKQDDSFRPLLRGSLIHRYQIRWNEDYWISFGDWLAEPRYSASYDAPKKIIIRQTGDSLIATLDEMQFIVRDNLYTMVPRQPETDLSFIIGLLNSSLLNWFYQNAINPERGEALAQVKRGHLAQIPIRTIDFSDPTDAARHGRMVELVQRMLDLHKQLAAEGNPQVKTMLQRQIEATDGQIDRLVYALYGLTEEEIAIVEGR